MTDDIAERFRKVGDADYFEPGNMVSELRDNGKVTPFRPTKIQRTTVP